MTQMTFWCLAGAFVAMACGTNVFAAGPRVLADGIQPVDIRLQPPKDLNGYFPFEVPETVEDWQDRRAELRRQLLVSQGLWPMPDKTPLNAVIHGKLDQGDYTIEKVYFESMPGFFTTGNLYRPIGDAGARPGVLCPHGHWPDGRFHDAGRQLVREMIVGGAERFEDGGRSPLQARCVQLARMGCVVFHYDMMGNADSQQISRDIVHGFAEQRAAMNDAENWGLYSPQAESHLQSIMGLQTISSIRALDFITTLPDVDAERIAVTGASGGGTQTFLLSALDDRVKISVPAVMVSTGMQGGCTCENASLLRIGTGNVEIAGVFAPKPQCLIAADDWTKEMATKGFPELKQLYTLLGAEDQVELHPFIHFPHNYNNVSRAVMYHWLNTHLQLGHETPILEQPYPRLTAEELTVWDDVHPRPVAGDEFEVGLVHAWTSDTRRKLDELRPSDLTSLQAYRDTVGGAIDVIIGRRLPAAEDVEFEEAAKTDDGTYLTLIGLLRNRPRQEELPITFLYPKEWAGKVAIWLSPLGKAGLYSDQGQPTSEVQRLLDSGVSVVGVDLLYQGEFLADGKPIERTRRVENERESAAYTFGYNHTLFVQRVHDVLSVISFVRSDKREPEEVYLVGLAGAGPWAAAARAQAGDAVDMAAIDTSGFRFANVHDIHSPDFVPGGAKYDDLPGMLALGAPGKLWLAGESGALPEIVAAAYGAADAENAVTLDSVSDSTASDNTAADDTDSDNTATDNTPAVAVEWLLRNE